MKMNSQIFDQISDLHQARMREKGISERKKKREGLGLRTQEEARIGNWDERRG